MVVASYGGSPQHPDWYVNLAADPEVEIQVGPDLMSARAATAQGAGRERLWTEMTAIWPAYDDYQGKTSRVIPVVRLEPAS